MSVNRRRRAWVCALLSPLLATAMACNASGLSKKYALVVGLNQYDRQAVAIPPLKHAVDDAEELATVLKRQGYLVTKLVDHDASRRGIIGQLIRHADIVKPSDSFVLFFAGHGIRRASNRQTYWVTYDFDPLRADIEGIRLSHLLELVRDIPAERKLILLDHCYSGDLVPVSGDADDDDGGRGPGEATMTIATARDATPTDFDAQVKPRGDGTVVLAASRGAAFELEDKGHGIFTYATLAALLSPNADPDKSGTVSINDFTQFVKRRIKDLADNSGNAQTTVFKIQSDDPDILNWTPFLRDPDATELPVFAQRYRDYLRRWFQQNRISPGVQSGCETALSRWEASADALSPKDQRIVDSMRELIDLDSTATDDDRARELQARVAPLVGGIQ